MRLLPLTWMNIFFYHCPWCVHLRRFCTYSLVLVGAGPVPMNVHLVRSRCWFQTFLQSKPCWFDARDASDWSVMVFLFICPPNIVPYKEQGVTSDNICGNSNYQLELWVHVIGAYWSPITEDQIFECPHGPNKCCCSDWKNHSFQYQLTANTSSFQLERQVVSKT